MYFLLISRKIILVTLLFILSLGQGIAFAAKIEAPPSLNKLMTLEILFQALKKGQVSLDDRFVVSKHAWRTGGGPSGTVSMLLPLKHRVKVSDLLKGVAVHFANDAAIVIAEGFDNSEENFARRLNRRAQQIDLIYSNFENATGFDTPIYKMSTTDLIILTRHLIKEYPEYSHYFSMPKFKYRNRTYYNRNPLNGLFDGFDALKAGSNQK